MHNEIASDIEWMLQSGQANDEMLLETLVHEYADRIFRFALAITGDLTLARQLTVSICAHAVQQTQRYHQNDGVDYWLANIAIQELRSAGRLHLEPTNLPDPLLADPAERLQSSSTLEKITLFLRHISGWQVQQIARVIKASEAATISMLEQKSQMLVPETGGNSDPEVLHGILESSWPVHMFSEQELEIILLQTRETALPKKTRYGLSLRFRESAIVCLVILLFAGLTWGINRFSPEEDNPDTALAMLNGTSSNTHQAPAQPFVYTVQAGDTLSDIAERLDLSVQDLLSLNGLNEGTSLNAGYQLLVLPGRNKLIKNNGPKATTAGAGTGMRLPLFQTNGLPNRATVQDVLNFWQTNEQVWQKLYLQAQWIDYGPSSYLGPLRMERFQAWIEQPGSSLLRSGALDGLPDKTHLVVDGEYYYLKTGEKTSIAWWDASTDHLFPDPRLEPVISPEKLLETLSPDSLVITGEERIAGRKAFIMQGTSNSGASIHRLWIDGKTGTLLRKQEISTPEQLVLTDLIVTQIIFEPDFSSTATFDLNRINPPLFSTDYRQPYTAPQNSITKIEPAVDLALRPLYAPVLPPAGFSPASSRLKFIFPENIENNKPQSWSVQILADGYNLGETTLGPYWQMQCQRSPEGMFLAYSISTEDKTLDESGIHWLSLLQPEQVFHAMTDFQILHFAFSPDGRKLAVFGRQVLTSSNALYLLDFATGAHQKLADLSTAQFITWKPDGSSISLLGSEPGKSGLQWMILHLETGLFTFSRFSQPAPDTDAGAAIYNSNQQPPQDYPAWAWGTDLTPANFGLDTCAEQKP